MKAALTIAGSDSGGGAGIQADLKTFAALEVHGLSVITAVTAQSTTEVRAIHAVPTEVVRAQLDAVLDDFSVSVAKTGMLGSAEVVRAVAAAVEARSLRAVVDPVMVAEKGGVLLAESALDALRGALIPRTEVLTPNIPEAAAILGRPVAELESSVDARLDAARAIQAMGARSVLVKGGHAVGPPTDVFVDADGTVEILAGARLETTSTHGTGCTYAAAIAALLARGLDRRGAVARAHDFVQRAIAGAPRTPELGRGRGPLHHLHPWYRWPEG